MYLRIKLLSDTTFGRGDGVAGVIDNEVEYDARTGLPTIKGRTIKGLLVEACADILFGLERVNPAAHDDFSVCAGDLFGMPGSDRDSTGWLHFGTATFPPDFVQRVEQQGYDPHATLNALTDIRYQTAVDDARDTPLDHTLRATRVVVRGAIFHAPITASFRLDGPRYALLAACANTVRCAGLNRTRGLGQVQVTLENADDQDHDDCLALFEDLAREARA